MINLELPQLDHKEIQKKMKAALEKYRLYKYLSMEEREVSITSGGELGIRVSSNKISDQTGNVAAYNVDRQEYRKKYCEQIEQAVKRLPEMERFLIEERYMTSEGDYLTDYQVYCFKFQPPISAMTYSRIRKKAFYRLALNLNIIKTM
ncbi:transcriptional regulator [Bacillaceae bacterium Marseille-Q3522]|nr:transcriptional regulator [Bacillaceae bacterium Marseille-Q3522]